MDRRHGGVTRLGAGGSSGASVALLALGTVFAVLAGLLAFSVSLRTLQLVYDPVGPLTPFALGAFGAVVTSLYSSMCLRIELDVGVVLPAATLGTGVLLLAPASTTELGGLPWALLATSVANSMLATMVTERFRGVRERFVAAAHHAQSVFLVGAVAWSFADMTVRWALALFGLIAWIGWHPSLLGSCALTLVEAKFDTASNKPELAERGFILYEIEKRFGVRLSATAWDRSVGMAALLLYSYWVVDLLT